VFERSHNLVNQITKNNLTDALFLEISNAQMVTHLQTIPGYDKCIVEKVSRPCLEAGGDHSTGDPDELRSCKEKKLMARSQIRRHLKHKQKVLLSVIFLSEILSF
jgi:hypothetical protein